MNVQTLGGCDDYPILSVDGPSHGACAVRRGSILPLRSCRAIELRSWCQDKLKVLIAGEFYTKNLLGNEEEEMSQPPPGKSAKQFYSATAYWETRVNGNCMRGLGLDFMVDVKEMKYYFLEVNSRIQVEHCISEEITLLDIVATQIYVALGGRLERCKALTPVTVQGHAIECRLCAEVLANDFLPAQEVIRRWTSALDMLPAHQTRNVRFETGIQAGTAMSKYFDSMIAKIVVWAPIRTAAINKMFYILRNTVCIGLQTNHLFLQSCLSHPGFKDRVDYTTSFIQDYITGLLLNPYSKS